MDELSERIAEAKAVGAAVVTHEGHTWRVDVRENAADPDWSVHAQALSMPSAARVHLMEYVQRADARTRGAAYEVGWLALRPAITEWATATIEAARRIEESRR
jgi:chitodextrinase